ncbi:hypothetical protein [Psychrobacter lutiphocae]|uniref:hypothetical protein n=1 Tax=Psychrobacter lutiphocae TaxID=540500 RepID=UPI00035E1EBA|nr:hypothetical protein [Psychrobacter lutiphocae]
MIFGNPGIYLDDGTYDDFSIIIEKLTTDLYSVNFCIDMKLFPTHLAYNEKQIILDAFNERDIFQQQSKELFYLEDRELMIALIKESFVNIYRIEQVISLGLYPKEYSDNELKKFEDLLDYDIAVEENRNKLWEIDTLEYTNKGFYVFIVNYGNETKIVFIQQKKYDDQDNKYGRFFHKDRSLKRVSFFDDINWSVKVVKVLKDDLISINSMIIDKLLS